MSFFDLLRQFAWRHRLSYAGFCVLLACITSLNVWLPRQIGHIVDGLMDQRLDLTALGAALGLMLLAALAIYFMRAGWRLLLFRAAYQLSVELRTRLFERLTRHAPGFYQHRRTGDLMAAATNDIEAIESAAGEGALAGYDGLVTLVMVIGAMAMGVDWRLALCAMLPFPFAAYAFKAISQKEHAAARLALDRFGHLNDHVQETLTGVRTVRALGLVEQSAQQFRDHAALAADAGYWEHRWEATFEPVVGMALATATAISLGVGSYLVWQGELTLGQLTSFGLYLGYLIWPMFAMGWVLSLLQRARAAWGRLEPLLSAPDDVLDTGTLALLPAPRLAWSGVAFRYPGQAHDAVHGIDCTVPPGQTLALVGPTGAGKSTLLKLLLRQWSPDAGEVSWGGVPVAQYRLAALREAVAWVPQEPFLFSASVAHNIALARPDASREQIEQAAQTAAVHDDILRLPNGYDTPVGERGVTLSGGQRQRIAIARALLAQAPVLLLDDALSAVDTETETRILAHLRRQTTGRTVVVVSHRLSAVVHADQTLVLQGGRIAERGHHAELVAHGGWYARQWRYQQLTAELDAA